MSAMYSVLFSDNDLDVLHEALENLYMVKEEEAKDAKQLMLWIDKTKKEAD